MSLLKPSQTWKSLPSLLLPRRFHIVPNFTSRSLHMNRQPRNRQQRPPRGQQTRGNGGRRGGGPHSLGSVPNTQQVQPGAAVSIILKEDQPTGREVQGIVQDLLTRGNHPRGIKVRLADGRVGRVQRMGSAAPSSNSLSTAHSVSRQFPDRTETPEGPPPLRSLADYLPAAFEPEAAAAASPRVEKTTFTTATATCPICGLFEGDEVAVSHHVNEHFS